jgi:hypothetical protein
MSELIVAQRAVMDEKKKPRGKNWAIFYQQSIWYLRLIFSTFS